MPKLYGSKQEDDEDVKVVTTPPETVGPVTVVTEEKGAKKMAAKNTIKVKGAGDDGKVVLWEKHPDHPNGEVFVCNDGKEHEVAETSEVKIKIRDGSILRVNWNS